jgi:TatD DNase family protein
MILTDTHTHLYSEDFDLDRADLITKANQKGVTRFFLPNVDSRSAERMFSLEKDYPEQCFAMAGLHPCSVKENYKEELEQVFKLLNQRSFYAVGEIGIDLYWDKTTLPQQIEAFRMQYQWAIERNLPIVIHCREAFDEVYAILQEFAGKTTKRSIFHCFSGNIEQAKKVIDLGFYIGVGGVVTFKNAGLDKVIEQLDLKDIVLETDAPYLAPMPYRGKRNEPAYLFEIAQKIADLKQCSIEEVAKITTANSKIIFGI